MDWPVVSKIYYNQEITVNYRPEEIRSSMKKSMELDFKLYQKWILRDIVFLKALPLEWKENYVGPFGSGIRNFTLDPKLYIPSTPNNSNETHTFMCLGRTGRFGQH